MNDRADNNKPQIDDSAKALWGYPSAGESRWPAIGAVFMALILQLLLPDRLTPGPRYVLPILEVLLLVPLIVVNPSKLTKESRNMRAFSIAVIALINAANIASIGLLLHVLLNNSATNGRELIYAAVGIWLTLVLVFGLWYWELDRGGPLARCSSDHEPPDFMFPQMENPGLTRSRWAPSFLDYMYVSLTNATAFSPTDTMPLRPRTKVLMGIQGLASLTTIAVVGARAVNILH